MADGKRWVPLRACSVCCGWGITRYVYIEQEFVKEDLATEKDLGIIVLEMIEKLLNVIEGIYYENLKAMNIKGF